MHIKTTPVSPPKNGREHDLDKNATAALADAAKVRVSVPRENSDSREERGAGRGMKSAAVTCRATTRTEDETAQTGVTWHHRATT
jgi:hypothetical protein